MEYSVREGEEGLSIKMEGGGEEVGRAGQVAPGGLPRERVGSLAQEQRGALSVL